jgi:uncharacterized membrane protein
VCFIGALVTDFVYWRTAVMQWTNFSAWLLAAGLVVGVLAIVAAIADLLRKRLPDYRKPGWPYLAAIVVAMVLAIFNSLIHTHDAWTSVVPTGLALSAASVVVLIVAGWLRWFAGPGWGRQRGAAA